MAQSLLVFQVLLMSFATTCTIYNVTPDGTTCHHCHNLQHYLLNTTKYFTSNTQLLFLPGLHHLPTNLIIQNVRNISLFGSTTNGTTPDTVIQCNPSVGIVMDNITSLTMRSITVQNCMTHYDSRRAAIIIISCAFLQVRHVQVYHNSKLPSLVGVDVLGSSSLDNVTCHGIHMYYYETEAKIKNHVHSVSFKHYNGKNGICVYMFQYSYKVTIEISNIFLQHLSLSAILHVTANSTVNSNSVFIENCQVQYNYNINEELIYVNNVSVHFSNSQFSSSQFVSNKRQKTVLTAINARNVSISHCVFKFNKKYTVLLSIQKVPNVIIQHCYFFNNNGTIIKLPAPSLTSKALFTDVVIQNTTFSHLIASSVTYEPLPLAISLFQFYKARLLLMGPVIFTNIVAFGAGIIDLTDSVIAADNYTEFSNNRAFSVITHHCANQKCFIMMIASNTVVNISSNELHTYFNAEFLQSKLYYPACYFQYVAGKNLDNQISSGKIRVVFDNNKFSNNFNFLSFAMHFLPKKKPISKYSYTFSIHITHCYWLPNSSFNHAIPVDVNKYYIQDTNNSNLHIIHKKSLCYCTNETHPDCYIDEIGPAYPGQTLTVSLYAYLNFFVNADVTVGKGFNETYITSCSVTKASENIQLIGKGCTNMKYTIAFPTDEWCELYLTVPQNKTMEQNIFYVRQLPCPLGFIKLDGVCQCYPMLKMFGFTNCDINKQAILCPANKWISLAHNNSHSYHVSHHCPLSYCAPFPTYTNLSTPDLQCQFNRSGILCGQCQHGLSTAFGSVQCQHCSNVYLFLIIPFAAAGIVLWFLLFLLGSTANNGTISAYILYVNVLSFNSTVFFPNQNNMIDKLIYTIVSISNLYLGIETCFYNGMDDYTKTWLRLVFPLCVILLTTLSMKVRCHCSVAQRLAQKAVLVLALLLLLSYTNILVTLSSVLFNFSLITHLPSKHTSHVWSVDANVTLFGVKYTALFITCLFLFILLILFSIMALFGRILLHFKVGYKFKPLLDIYHEPYKLKFHYWTGLQLAIRIVFFGLSLLDRDTNLISGIVALNILCAIYGTYRPLKRDFDNYQHIALNMNLLLLYTLALSGIGDTSKVVDIIVFIAIAQFCITIVCQVVIHKYHRTIRSRALRCINQICKLFRAHQCNKGKYQ